MGDNGNGNGNGEKKCGFICKAGKSIKKGFKKNPLQKKALKFSKKTGRAFKKGFTSKAIKRGIKQDFGRLQKPFKPKKKKPVATTVVISAQDLKKFTQKKKVRKVKPRRFNEQNDIGGLL